MEIDFTDKIKKLKAGIGETPSEVNDITPDNRNLKEFVLPLINEIDEELKEIEAEMNEIRGITATLRKHVQAYIDKEK